MENICAYCVTIILICLNILMIFVVDSFSIASKLFIDGMCVVVLVPTTMRGATIHLLAML